MDMLLLGLCMTMLGLGVAAVAFKAATRSKSSDSDVQPEVPLVKTAAPTLFVSNLAGLPPSVAHHQVPIEVLMLQLENHIRMEQAAAESFVEFPTQALLHSKTISPFVN